MGDALSQLSLDRAGIGPVSIRRDPVRHPIGDNTSRTKERLSGCLILALAQPHVHQVAVLIYGPVEVDFPTLDLQIGFVTVPAPPYLPMPVLAERLAQYRSEFGFPLEHGFMSEDHGSL